jgi:hypothetical protein
MNRNVTTFSKKESDDVDGDKLAALMTSIDEIPFDDEMLHDAHSILVLLLITKAALLEWESPGPGLNDRARYISKRLTNRDGAPSWNKHWPRSQPTIDHRTTCVS